jgi:hypothetical protein
MFQVGVVETVMLILLVIIVLAIASALVRALRR